MIQKLEDVKDTVKVNINSAIDRHDSIALLQHKTNELQDSGASFRNRSRRLQYQYCRDLYKQRCVVITIIFFVIYLLSAMICGWSWESCGSSKQYLR